MSDLPDKLVEALKDRYTLQRELGRGGMSTVYLADDRKHHRPVAIKVLLPELAAAIGPDRFHNEIEVASGLSHPHILPLHDSGSAAGTLYYVMPYVEGQTLRDRLAREKQLPIEDAVQVTREVADGLHYAHTRGVIHRDVKPENILLTSSHAVIADFGIARAIDRADESRVTATGLTVGTPTYMSPEQASGSRDLDGRSDIYSLGCVLFEMLAGQPPFTAPTAQGLVRQHLAAEPPDITAIRPSVPPGVALVLSRCLAKAPADRFRTAHDVGQALDSRDDVRKARTSSGWRRRYPVHIWAPIASVTVVAAVLLALGMGGERRPSPPMSHSRTAIAVLPFQNLSADDQHRYFAGGLHDELVTQLSKISALSLRARTSTSSYASTDKPIKQIGEELAVGSIVQGTVQVVGDRLRVSVQLIDAATDEHLWAEGYERTIDDAFAIQSEVAQRVAAGVGASLKQMELRAIAGAPTSSPEAYRLYLQGRDYFRHPGRRPQPLEIAQQLYERALTIDPQFALAYAALSELHGEMHWYRFDPSPNRIVEQRRTAMAALELAPELPQARVAMGLWHYWGRRDYRAALDEFTRASKGLPQDAELVGYIGSVHRRLGRWEEVHRAYLKAVELDPRNTNLHRNLGGLSYEFTRQYAEAVRAYDRALSLTPDLTFAAIRKGWTYVHWEGRFDSLRTALQRIPWDLNNPITGRTNGHHAMMLLWTRDADSLLTLLRSVEAGVFLNQGQFHPTALYAAWAHQLRGDSSSARAAFDSALTFLASARAELHDDWRLHSARGLALAGLGRRAEALREAEWLERSPVYRSDEFDGPDYAADRAMILAHAGEAAVALDGIERILMKPAFLSVNALRLDPRWDPIRDHPGFRRLVAR